MNPHTSLNYAKINEPPGEMSVIFDEGVRYYDEYFLLTKKNIRKGEDPEERMYQIGFQRTMAIEAFCKCIDAVLPPEKQDLQIQALFFLVELHEGKEGQRKREGYFYQAVGLIEHSSSPNFQNSTQWQHAITLYIHVINPHFIETFPKKYVPALSQLLTVSIIAEYKKRMQLHLEDAANTLKMKSYPDTPMSMIHWLEEIFGPMRIHIRSLEGEVEILSHRIGKNETSADSNDKEQVHHTTVEIFDKKTEYSVTVDRGSSERLNKFRESHLEHIIYPIIDTYIQKREYATFFDAADHGAFIQRCEENVDHETTGKNYRGFIHRVLSKYSGKSSPTAIDKCQQSLDICRMVTLTLSRENQHSLDMLPQKIDDAVGGVIRRDVLALVQSHLITRYEMMNGTGYPFGLSKRRILLESRIYKIIRAYEAISKNYGIQQTISILENWGNGGYFDTDILSIFLDILRNDGYPSDIPPKAETQKVSSHRKNLYSTHIDRWKAIVEQIEGIEKDYDAFRGAYAQSETQNSITKSMNEGILSLRRIAKIRTIFIVTRHGETESDMNSGPPGNDDETIALVGKVTSTKKGNILKGLRLCIHTSPILRGRESATIICQNMHECVRDTCNSCSHILVEKVMENPKKDKVNGRYNSHAQKLFQDNTNGLMEFLIDTVSSSEESSHLCVTHRDTGRHLIFWLTNLFSQDTTFGEKTPIGNDTILVYFFEGDTCIPWNLCFPVFGYKDTLDRINTISHEVFGVPFYPDIGSIDLIVLHDLFLDFLDNHRERSPLLFPEFQKRLKEDTLTSSVSEMINIS